MEVTGEPSTENELINDDWRVWILFIVCFIVYGIYFLQFGRWLGAVDPDIRLYYGIVYYIWHDSSYIPAYYLGCLIMMCAKKVIKQIPEGKKELREWLEERKERRSRSR